MGVQGFAMPRNVKKPPPLARLAHVHAAFGAVTVFPDLSLCLHAGRHLALIGPNGAGKSTLLRLLQGELRPVQSADPAKQGRVIWGFEGREDPSPLSAREHARLVSPGMQRNYARQGWTLSGEDIILSGLDNATMLHGECSARQYERAAALAGAAGASGLLSLTAPAMSQGQLRLILILRALISRPALLLLDEPFDGLDAPAREAVNRAMELAAGNGATLALSAHRVEDVPAFVTDILHVEGGTVRPLNKREVARLTAKPAPPAPSPRAAKARSPKTTQPPAATAALPLLELSHVDVFIDRRQVLFDINWTVLPGEQWLLSGRNGAGKSTLLRLLYGEEFAAYGGSVRWRGRPRPGLEELRAGVGYVSDRLQDGYDYDLRAEEVVISGLGGSMGLYHEPDEQERELARFWLARMDAAHLAARPFHALSSGNARRVLLARALAGSPPVLLLDEPCSGLDPESRALFLAALPELAARGVTLFYVSHRQEDAGPLFSHELVLDAGRVVSAGPRPGPLQI